MSLLPSSLVAVKLVAVNSPRQDGGPSSQSDALNAGLKCVLEEIVPLDVKIDNSISPSQVHTVKEKSLSRSPASARQHVPLQTRNEPLQNGCFSNFEDEPQTTRQASSRQKVDDFTRDDRKRPENTKSSKKRKTRHGELATLDVVAAVASVVSASEAVVLGYLMDFSMLPAGQDRSIIVEAALSLGKARQSCGLDKYELTAGIEDYDDLATQDLDDEIMQEAYADVGMMVDVLEDQTQLLDVGPEVAHLSQNDKCVQQPPHSCDLEAGSIVTQPIASGGDVCEGHERGEDSAQAHSFGMQERNETTENIQALERASTIEVCDSAKLDGQEFDSEVKEASCKSIAAVSCDADVEIAELVLGSQEINGGEVKCQREVDAPDILLSTTSLKLEVGQPGGEQVTACAILPTQTTKSIVEVSSGPADKSEGRVASAPESEVAITSISANSDIACENFLVKLDSVVGHIQDQAEHQREVHANEGDAIEVGASEDKATQPFESGELHPELSLSSKARASPESNWSYPGVGKSSAITKDPPMVTRTNIVVSPYVSRWLGGWSNNDAVPERNALIALEKSTPYGLETVITERYSVHETEVKCLPQNGPTSEMIESDASQQGSQALHMSQIDPLCSFVPCSISPPTTQLLLPCQRGDLVSTLAATVEACARTAVNIIDTRKVADYQQEGQAAEEESLPDPAVRTYNERSGLFNAMGDSASPAVTKDVAVKRSPTSMKRLSTTTNSLSLLLHAVDVAEDCILDGDDLERPSNRFLNLILSPPLDRDHSEGIQAEEERSTDCGTKSTTDMPDVNLSAGGKGQAKKRRMPSPDHWMSTNLSDSPPLLWPRRKKPKLTACRVIDSDSNEWLHDHADDHHMAQKDVNDNDGMLQTLTQQLDMPVLRTSTRSSKPCHDPKTLFKGLPFLLTGFSSELKEKISKSIEGHGGKILADVPAFSPKQRLKRRGVDCGARSPPIVIAPQEMRTHKYLYGCAVGSPLLKASWISASVSALKRLPYPAYQHKQTRAGDLPQKDRGGHLKNTESPLFAGFQFLFHGQQESISQLSTVAKHAGGKVIRKLVLNASERKQGQKLVGLVVVEGSINLPLDLQRAASKLKWQVVDAEWVVVSLLNGKLLPFAPESTPPGSVVPSQQSSASNTKKPLQRYSRRRRIRLEKENVESRHDGDSGIILLVKKLKDRSPVGEDRPSSSIKAKLGGTGREDQSCNTCWLGKGFTSPPPVPQLANVVLGPYSHSLAHHKLPKRFLHYEAVICNGVKYSVGDVVEVRLSTADGPHMVVRIEGLWSEEVSGLPQTRAFQQGVRKMALKTVTLKCRRFFRPTDTGFPGQQQHINSLNELYLSNDIDISFSASHIVRRVRVTLETAGQVVHCDNWYGDDAVVDDSQKRAGPLSVCQKKVTETGTSLADYFCSFFYDHVGESLHRIKLKV